LFATHYHELNVLASTHPRIKNFHVATQEVGNKVIFLRKLVEGGTEHSFGIHVAKMAGMPKSILTRAQDVLRQLEEKEIDDGVLKGTVKKAISARPDPLQLSIFEHVDPTAGRIKQMLADINVNQLTPIECMLKLIELQKLIDED
jgi:DNA mismatch repair protein MutS